MIVFLEDADRDRVYSYGLKGVCLGEMLRLGLNVPPGFIIPREIGEEVYLKRAGLGEEVFSSIMRGVTELERRTGRRLGGQRPLLLSIRSGGSVPLPGMMDTVLNVGVNPDTVSHLAEESGDERYAWDTFRRFVQMYGEIVLGIPPISFNRIIEEYITRVGGYSEEHLGATEIRRICDAFRAIIKKHTGNDVPSDPEVQLKNIIEVVFNSWNTPRAVVFRNLRNIPHDFGTAVVVQAMVFGNFGKNSAAGVVSTRNPNTGMKTLFGEYLPYSQGEDILSGARTPRRISELQYDIPDAFAELEQVGEILEKHYRDVQEIEFTIEHGKLYLLQTHPAQCTAQGRIKIAVDMYEEKLLTKKDAVKSVDPDLLKQILHSHIDPAVHTKALARGLPAAPGAASGAVVFSEEDARRLNKDGKKAILVRTENTTEDVRGIYAAAGLLTQKGGVTSHAAVVARRMARPCVTGCENVFVDVDRKEMTIGSRVVREGDIVTIDGNSGRVFLGSIPMRNSAISSEFTRLLSWTDKFRTLRVRANAETTDSIVQAISFGAEGIGLCRTEVMFMTEERQRAMMAMILEENKQKKNRQLAELQKIHKQDFLEIFTTLDGLPVTIRLLDTPLHEFLPAVDDLSKELAVLRSQGINDEDTKQKEDLLTRILLHQEKNPMMGLRGCRLGIISPEIIEMQATAILEAAAEVSQKGIPVMPEIIIPLIGHVKELRWVRHRLEAAAEKVFARMETRVDFKIGTLVEVPRAALTADELAEYSDFLSFGTNDLTQTTFGFSRDDAEHKFLRHYHDLGILHDNPFETIDEEGVGKLVKYATNEGRRVKHGIVIGLCGEHGGEPRSIVFCHKTGLDYVSCAPYRVPIARLAAAQAAIADEEASDGKP